MQGQANKLTADVKAMSSRRLDRRMAAAIPADAGAIEPNAFLRRWRARCCR